MQYQKGYIWNHRVCVVRRNSAVSLMSHLWYEERKCAVHGESHLLYRRKVVQCEERVYSIRKATSAIEGQGACSEQKLCSIRNFTSEVRGEKVCSTRRVACAK